MNFLFDVLYTGLTDGLGSLLSAVFQALVGLPLLQTLLDAIVQSLTGKAAA